MSLPILAVIGMPPVRGAEPAPAPAPVTLVLPEPEAADAQANPHRPRPLPAPRIVVERPCGACQPEETATQAEPAAAPEPRDLAPLPPGYVGVASAAAPDDRADGITGSIEATLASAGTLVAQTIGRGQHALPMDSRPRSNRCAGQTDRRPRRRKLSLQSFLRPSARPRETRFLH